MAEEEKKTTKKTKKVEEVTPEKVEKKTKKATPKKEAKDVTDLVVAEKKTPVKKKTTAKKKVEEPKVEEVKEEPKKEKKTKAKVVGYDSHTGKPVYDNPDGEKPVKFDIKTGKPIYEDEIQAKVEEPKVEVKADEPKVENVPAKVEEPLAKVENTQAVVTPVPPVVAPPVDQTITVDRSTLKSEFDGKLIQLIGWYLLGLLISIVTLGIGEPFAKCFILSWQYKHTKINGRRLCFDGNGLQLLGNYIKWTFFTIITLGIYLIFLPVRWNKWVVKHTHYEGNKKPVVNYSLFDGTTWDFIGLSILCFFLKLFSLGLLTPFCDTLMYSWRINHTTYDTIDMEFDGKGFQLLGNYIKWTFFTIITLGIYGLWVPIKRIQWEVKHTNEKGFSKHPYKAVWGMILPVILCVLFIIGGVFGLSRVDKETWIGIRDDANHYVNSIINETKRYDFGHVMAERVSDMFYRANNSDMNISWDERYDRFFRAKWYDKLSDNIFSRVFTGRVEMAALDIEDIDTPVIIAKYDDMYRVFWLYEKRIENHFYYAQAEQAGLYVATDKDGKEHIAVVQKDKHDSYDLIYIHDTVEYDDYVIVSGSDYERFLERLENKGIKLEKLDVHFTKVDVDDMDGFDEMVEYYYDHTDKKYERKPVEVKPTYKDEYIEYLRKNFKGEYSVVVLDKTSSDKEVLVVIEKNKTTVVSYNEEIVTNSISVKGYLGALKNTSTNKTEHVIVVTDGKYKVYYLVDSMLKEGTPKSFKVKSNNLAKGLREKGYKEAYEDFELISISKEEDLSKIESALKEK